MNRQKAQNLKIHFKPLIMTVFLFATGCGKQVLTQAEPYPPEIYRELTVTEASQRMQQGQISSEQLVKYYIDRIDQFDRSGPALRSVAVVNPKALSLARERDRERQAGKIRGPLHGIPVLLKDNIDTGDGMANTAGSRALATNFPDSDAFVVQQLRKAGAVILGKTNLSEWANFRSTRSSSGWSGQWGQSKNPYDPLRSPCGSSSGSGIAVAADFTLLAVGTETDGSVTCPAAINGIVGIKPSLGLVSRSGIIPIAHSQDTAGAMARTVTDAVMLLQAMIGHDQTDAFSQHHKIKLVNHLKKDGLKGKRIGVVRNLMGYHSDLDAVFERQLEILKKQGAIIVDGANIETLGQWDGPEFNVLLMEFKTDLENYLSGTRLPYKTLEDLIAFNRQDDHELFYFGQEIFEMAAATQGIHDKKYPQSLADAKRLAGKEGIDATLKKHRLDLLIAPTTGPAWSIDLINGDHYLGSASSPAAVAGYPHITVPMGYVHGLPVGLSFFAGNLSEPVLIEAAYGFEQASTARRPVQLEQKPEGSLHR